MERWYLDIAFLCLLYKLGQLETTNSLSLSLSGLLLRMFSYLYDMDVIEEESFFKWKEDISQEFPGKGQALFQVKIKSNSSAGGGVGWPLMIKMC